MVGKLMYSVLMIVLANFLTQPNSWNTEVDSVDFMKIRLLKNEWTSVCGGFSILKIR